MSKFVNRSIEKLSKKLNLIFEIFKDSFINKFINIIIINENILNLTERFFLSSKIPIKKIRIIDTKNMNREKSFSNPKRFLSLWGINNYKLLKNT